MVLLILDISPLEARFKNFSISIIRKDLFVEVFSTSAVRRWVSNSKSVRAESMMDVDPSIHEHAIFSEQMTERVWIEQFSSYSVSFTSP